MSKLPDSIQISWSYLDVKYMDDTLTEDEAREVLQEVKHYHDCTIGINWEIIDTHIDIWKSRRDRKQGNNEI